MELPVEMKSGTGVTRDVSSSGVYIRTDEVLTPGLDIQFSLELAYAFDTAVHLCCRGRVLRVERERDGLGVAARITSLRIGSSAFTSGTYL